MAMLLTDEAFREPAGAANGEFAALQRDGHLAVLRRTPAVVALLPRQMRLLYVHGVSRRGLSESIDMLRRTAVESSAPEALASSTSEGESPFHELVSEREVTIARRADDSFVAECTGTRHPTLTGRIQIAWEDESGESRLLWAPVLAHLSLRVHDRVLVLRPRSFPEPLVVGLVDGFDRSPEASTQVAAVLEVKRDEKVQIVAENGAPLVEVTRDGEGPVVRVMSAATRIELPGNLQITADEIVLRARQGKVEIDANDDVVVTGEHIRLN